MRYFVLFVSFFLSLVKGNDRSEIDSEYPLIMYAVPFNEKSFGEAKSLGINCIHNYSLSSGELTNEKLQSIEDYLNLAFKYKLKVMFDLDGNRRIKEGRIDEIKLLINTFKDHVALKYWYLSDEPELNGISVNQLTDYYEILKFLSPKIPVAICHAWANEWYKYTNVQDIMLIDLYPVTYQNYPLADLGKQTRFINSAKKLNSTNLVIPVLQFFNMKSLDNEKSKKFSNSEYNELRYPNFIEFRYLCFSAIAKNVNALSFYSLARNSMIKSDWNTEIALPILKEVKDFLNIINKSTYSSIIEEDKYFISKWKDDLFNYYIIVNKSSDNININININIKSILGNENLQIIGNNNKIKLLQKIDGLVLENIMPWEILILKQKIN